MLEGSQYPFLSTQDKKEHQDTKTDTSYCQWIQYMFFINGLIFMLPKKIWTYVESDFVEKFVNDKTGGDSIIKTFHPSDLIHKPEDNDKKSEDKSFTTKNLK